MPQENADESDEDESHQPLDQPYDFDPEKVTLTLVFLLSWRLELVAMEIIHVI